VGEAGSPTRTRGSPCSRGARSPAIARHGGQPGRTLDRPPISPARAPRVPAGRLGHPGQPPGQDGPRPRGGKAVQCPRPQGTPPPTLEGASRLVAPLSWRIPPGAGRGRAASRAAPAAGAPRMGWAPLPPPPLTRPDDHCRAPPGRRRAPAGLPSTPVTAQRPPAPLGVDRRAGRHRPGLAWDAPLAHGHALPPHGQPDAHLGPVPEPVLRPGPAGAGPAPAAHRRPAGPPPGRLRLRPGPPPRAHRGHPPSSRPGGAGAPPPSPAAARESAVRPGLAPPPGGRLGAAGCGGAPPPETHGHGRSTRTPAVLDTADGSARVPGGHTRGAHWRGTGMPAATGCWGARRSMGARIDHPTPACQGAAKVRWL
jgi:hypothetical protein